MKKILLISIAFVYISLCANAQVTSYSIDETINQLGNQYHFHIDINQDGVRDFTLQFRHTIANGGLHTFSCNFGSHEGNEVLRPSYQNVIPFNSGANIGPSLSGWYKPLDNYNSSTNSWSEHARLVYIFGGFQGAPIGNFSNVNNKFIGVRFFSGTDTLYGYIEVSSTINSSNPSFTIHSVGYNAVPNGSIAAGDLGSCTQNMFALSAVNIDMCNNSLINSSLVVTGGISPYTYEWSTGATTAALTNISPDYYRVTITDYEGCKLYRDINLDVLDIDVQKDASCFNGSDGEIVIEPLFGNGPYTYLWNNGATTKDLINVEAGDYFVTITDAIGCSNVKGPITLTQPTQMLLDLSISQSQGGSITAFTTGGNPPYTALWSTGSTQFRIENLGTNTAGYSVTITDSNGCEVSATSTFVAIDKVNLINNIQITPNPVSQEVRLQLSIAQKADVTVELINTFGQVLDTVNNSDLESLVYIHDMSIFPSGVYFIRVITNYGEVQTTSFIRK